MLHALVWRATNDRLRATRIAATVGGAIAILLIAAGIAQALLTGSGIAGLWTVFIGWFLLVAGNAERRQSEVAAELKGHTAADLIAPNGLRVSADETADRVLQTMRDQQTRVLPVYVADRFIGFASIDDMAKVPYDDLPRTYVTAIMTREEDATPVAPSDDANEVLRAMAERGVVAIPVVAPGGALLGLVTRDSVMHWLSDHLRRQPARS